LHCITLHYITLHYITLHYITLHYITLQYVPSTYQPTHQPHYTQPTCRSCTLLTCHARSRSKAAAPAFCANRSMASACMAKSSRSLSCSACTRKKARGAGIHSGGLSRAFRKRTQTMLHSTHANVCVRVYACVCMCACVCFCVCLLEFFERVVSTVVRGYAALGKCMSM